MKRAHDKLAHGYGAAFGEEGLDAQVRVHAFHLGRVHRAVSVGGNAPEADTFGDQGQRNRTMQPLGRGDRVVTNAAQLGGHLVRQHLFQAQAEEVGSVTTVGAGHHVAAGPGRATRTAVAEGATIGQAGADGDVGIDIAGSVTFIGPLSLQTRELALKELAATPDGPERVALDDEDRGIRSHGIAAAGPDLLLQ